MRIASGEGDLAARVFAGLLLRWLRRKAWVQPGAADHIDHVKRRQHEARDHRAGIELDDRDVGGRRIDDQHDRGRDQDAETAAGADHARGKADVIFCAQHRRKSQEAHERDHSTDDAGRSRKHRAGGQGSDSHGARQLPRRDVERVEEPGYDIGALDDIAHEQKQRHGGEHVIRHDRIGLIDEQIEDAVVKKAFEPGLPKRPAIGALLDGPFIAAPHAPRIEIGIVAEEDSHRHQGEGDRKAQKDAQKKQAEHRDGDLGIGHGRSLFFSGTLPI